MWTACVDVPSNTDTLYRYFISSTSGDATSDEVHVRRWETHITPRKINNTTDTASSSYDTFGEIDGVTKVDRGWLTTERAIQLVFFKNPFVLKGGGVAKSKQLLVKVTPMNLRVSSAAADMATFLEDSMSNDTHDTNSDQAVAYAFVECATLGGSVGSEDVEERHSHFQPQGQFGKAYSTDDVLIFHVTVNEPQDVAYLIDLYCRRLSAPIDEPPTHLGYHYILPNLLKQSEGLLDVPVTCASKHRPLGMMHVEYLNVRGKVFVLATAIDGNVKLILT